MIDEEAKRGALARLDRIEGQVQGVQRIVEEQKYCVDALMQISAIQGALGQVGSGERFVSCQLRRKRGYG